MKLKISILVVLGMEATSSCNVYSIIYELKNAQVIVDDDKQKHTYKKI